MDERWGLVDRSVDQLKVGYTIAGAVEFQLTSNWSMALDYSLLHFPINSTTFEYGTSATPERWTYDFEHQASLVTHGINYRF